MKQNSNFQAGFTLLEVLIALVIFSIGILAVGAMQISAIKGNSIADRLTAATNAAGSQVEQFMNWSYTDTRLASGNDTVYTLPGGGNITADGNQTSPDGSYEVYWNVTDDSPVTDSKTIEITAWWQSRGRQKSLELVAIKARE